MACLAGLYLASMAERSGSPLRVLFEKLRGVYTYGGPMAVSDHDQARCQELCGELTFRHVYYNDLVPHLPPLSCGGFDHFGSEYRYHPQVGWRKQESGLFRKGRCTQVVSVAVTAPFGVLDGILDNIDLFSFFRGEHRNWPIVGVFSRGYLKMMWSVVDHSPIGYIHSLEVLPEGGGSD